MAGKTGKLARSVAAIRLPLQASKRITEAVGLALAVLSPADLSRILTSGILPDPVFKCNLTQENFSVVKFGLLVLHSIFCYL